MLSFGMNDIVWGLGFGYSLSRILNSQHEPHRDRRHHIYIYIYIYI